jgi:hypothetical protein
LKKQSHTININILNPVAHQIKKLLRSLIRCSSVLVIISPYNILAAGLGIGGKTGNGASSLGIAATSHLRELQAFPGAESMLRVSGRIGLSLQNSQPIIPQAISIHSLQLPQNIASYFSL